MKLKEQVLKADLNGECPSQKDCKQTPYDAKAGAVRQRATTAKLAVKSVREVCMDVYSAEEIKLCDKGAIEAGVAETELIERAAKAAVEEIRKLLAPGKKVLAVCGGGNNGADAFCISAMLSALGYDVSVYAATIKLNAAGRHFKSGCKKTVADLSGEYDVILDGLFGTGLSRNIEGSMAEIIKTINAKSGLKVAVDIASGLNSDTGAVMGAVVKADKTITFMGYKRGQLLGDGRDMSGEIIVKDIGIENVCEDAARLTDENIVKPFFMKRKINSNKGTYKRAAIVAGSQSYFGSAVLSCSGMAALRSGSGYCYLLCEKELIDMYRLSCPEIIVADVDGELPPADCIAIGMGMGMTDTTKERVLRILNEAWCPVILDADAINVLKAEELKPGCILTPHIKEFARISGLSVEAILKDKISAAQRFAKKYKVILALKGATTVITDGKRTRLNITGTPALAKGGSGDVLSGIASALVARGEDAFDAICAATYLFGKAGERADRELGEYSVIATDLIKYIPEEIKSFTAVD